MSLYSHKINVSIYSAYVHNQVYNNMLCILYIIICVTADVYALLNGGVLAAVTSLAAPPFCNVLGHSSPMQLAIVLIYCTSSHCMSLFKRDIQLVSVLRNQTVCQFAKQYLPVVAYCQNSLLASTTACSHDLAEDIEYGILT